jgi:hypothetical protein
VDQLRGKPASKPVANLVEQMPRNGVPGEPGYGFPASTAF